MNTNNNKSRQPNNKPKGKQSQNVNPPKQSANKPPRRPRARRLRPLPLAAKSYYTCKLDPFNSPGGVGIPDASSGSRITVDHRQFYDVVVSSSGSLRMLLVPSPSNPIFFKDTVNNTNGGSVSSNGISYNLSTTRANTTGSWIAPPIAAWANFSMQSPTVLNVPNPYTATKFRIVTQALRFTYTGAALNSAGIISVFPNIPDTNASPVSNKDVITPYFISGAVTTASYPVNSVEMEYLNLNWATIPLHGTGVYKVANGFEMLNKKTSPIHEFTDIPDGNIILTENGQTIPLKGSPVGGSTTDCGISGYDPHWMCPQISITGMTAGTSFRVEVLTCIEYMLAPSSSFAPLAKNTPSLSQPLLQNIDKRISTVPLSGDPGTFRRILNSILRNAGPVTSIFAGPAIGGAVGTITNAFRRSFI